MRHEPRFAAAFAAAWLASGCYLSHERLEPETPLGPLEGAVQIGAGNQQSCARLESGRVVCWGAPYGPATRPVEVEGAAGAFELAIGHNDGCARLVSGAVVCWGGPGGLAPLGDGRRTGSATPVEVVGLDEEVVELSVRAVKCARFVSGGVACWGLGREQLGVGPQELDECGDSPDHLVPCARTPMRVWELDDAVQISVGGLHACALRASGEVVCWGDNTYGELGDGTTEPSDVPIAVPGLVDVVEVAAGVSLTCARQASGEVVCWGRGDGGRLGDGAQAREEDCEASSGDLTECALAPVTVSGLSDAVAIAPHLLHSCALRASGRVSCWGTNGSGQLGDGTTRGDLSSSSQRYAPVDVVGLDDAVEVVTGLFHTCARRAAGAVLCWGWNRFGRLGDGTTEDRSVPTPVVAPRDPEDGA